MNLRGVCVLVCVRASACVRVRVRVRVCVCVRTCVCVCLTFWSVGHALYVRKLSICQSVNLTCCQSTGRKRRGGALYPRHQQGRSPLIGSDYIIVIFWKSMWVAGDPDWIPVVNTERGVT